MYSSWLNWLFTNESYAVARPLFRERHSPVEVCPGQTPAHSQPLIAYTTTIEGHHPMPNHHRQKPADHHAVTFQFNGR